ncbi:lasso peptide biosynthesis B2 protein [Streptomyces sp. NPDC003077]|uniref:lasso peptide biosynthesis B2 protein n=1 Tax=Streptomyces sp. NPDC003077 TaxID=3154443 RepID=UPI0033AF1418
MTLVQARPTVAAGTVTERCAARLGLLLAVLLLRLLPFRHTLRVVRLARRLGRRPLPPDRAEDLVTAVRHTGRHWPLRLACLETSLASVLAAALLRRHLAWCLGARFVPPPVEYHAWAALPGHGPVGEYTVAGWHHHTALTI